MFFQKKNQKSYLLQGSKYSGVLFMKPSKCAALVGVGDMWVLGTCGCGGHVGVGDMRVSGTCGCRGHEGVGDLYSGGSF